MKNQKKIRLIFSIMLMTAALFFMVSGGSALAQGLKERMRDRLPVIVNLKAKELVGENNQGYLEALKGKQAPADVVAAENRDRREAYQAIANQTKTGIDVVGQRRALQIAEKAASGEWLQNAAGQWYKKP